jgi:hypothetical protein
MANTQIKLPEGIIEAYDQAQREFSLYYYDHIILRIREYQGADVRLIDLLELFRQALEYIVYAATARDKRGKEDFIQEAYNSLTDIILICMGNVEQLNSPLTQDVELPEDIIKFHGLVKKAYAQYIAVTYQRDTPSLPHFTAVLDYIVAAARSNTSPESKNELLVLAKGRLFGIVFSLLSTAMLTLRREIVRAGRSKLYRQMAFLWKNLPSTGNINLYILDLDTALTYGYTHRHRIDMAGEYIARLEDACTIASPVREYLKQRSLRMWVTIGNALLISITGSLIFAGIVALFKFLKDHYPALGF